MKDGLLLPSPHGTFGRRALPCENNLFLKTHGALWSISADLAESNESSPVNGLTSHKPFIDVNWHFRLNKNLMYMALKWNWFNNICVWDIHNTRYDKRERKLQDLLERMKQHSGIESNVTPPYMCKLMGIRIRDNYWPRVDMSHCKRKTTYRYYHN